MGRHKEQLVQEADEKMDLQKRRVFVACFLEEPSNSCVCLLGPVGSKPAGVGSSLASYQCAPVQQTE